MSAGEQPEEGAERPEDGPARLDPDRWALDERFVSGAHQVEPSAADRGARRARAPKPPRQPRIGPAEEQRFAARAGREARRQRIARWLVIGAVVALVVLTAVLGWWAGDPQPSP